MANDYTKNPIYLDTQMIECDHRDDYFTIHRITWVAPSGVGNQVHIEDSGGQVLIDATCDTLYRNITEYFQWGKVYKGIYMDRLDSGHVLIWLQANN